MNDYREKFIDSLESPMTKRVAKSVLSKIDDDDLTQYELEQMQQLLISLRPKSERTISNVRGILKLYFEWLEKEQIVKNNNLSRIISDVNRKEIWRKAKQNAPKKYISHDYYEEVVSDIGTFEEFNALYYQTLFRCVYEGIYNEDLSVIKNLRASDIKDNIATLKNDDGYSYNLEISSRLAEDLKKLSNTYEWEQKNAYTSYTVDIEGLYYDSCFKLKNNKRAGKKEDAYRFGYYNKLRKISKDFLSDNKILPLEIFVSGIMYRIRLKLEEYGITLEEAFREENRNRIVNNVITNELKRCNRNMEVFNFREMVKGHIEVFYH